MIAVNGKHFDKLLQCHKAQPLQILESTAASPRSIFTTTLMQMNTWRSKFIPWIANMTTDKYEEFCFHLSHCTKSHDVDYH